MAKVTYIDGIDTIRGALDSVKEGQANRARLVCKWHYWGEKWVAVCREASRIAKDPNHPRYQEMVERHAAQLRGKPDPVLGKKHICQFGNFVRAVLIHEQ